jgi:cytoskeleton protein RodZ
MTETIGNQLKKARESKNLTIQQVVQGTRIRAHLIEAIEADDFASLPSEIQAHAFLKLYADFLNLSLKEIIAEQRARVEESTSDLPNLKKEPPEDIPEVKKERKDSFNKVILKVANNLKSLLSRYKPVISIRKASRRQLQVDTAREQSENSEQSKEVQPSLFLDNTSQTAETLGSQAIFIKIGEIIRQRREDLSLSLDEIENHTHINIHYLTALENGEFGLLPSSVQARGMLNNYALFLNLDVDEILLLFAEALQLQRKEREHFIEQDIRKTKKSTSDRVKGRFHLKFPTIFRQYLSLDTLVGGGLVFLLLVFAFWGTSRIINLREVSTPQPTPLPMSNLIISNLGEITATATSLPASESINNPVIPSEEANLTITMQAGSSSPVQIVVIAQDQSWVRVTVDGKVQFEGRVTPGTAYPYNGNTQIEVLTGNGLAIEIVYNQNNLGPMGNFGEVIDRIYTANLVLFPTATNTQTPTITPTPTITLPPTATLRPSATPRFTPTSRPTSASGQ